MKLKKYLSQNKMTLDAFGKIIGVKPQSVHRYVHNVQPPRPSIAHKIIKETKGKVTLADLYQPTGHPQ